MTVQDLIRIYTEVYYLEDTSVIPIVVATVLSSKMKGDPVWLMIVGGSSSGKSEIVNAIGGVPWLTEISMLTTNTLLSGMKTAKGKAETSLLLRMPPEHILTMKDFTTILSMRSEEQQDLMAQFRELYDGKMTKQLGTGEVKSWKGKSTLIAGVTEKLYAMEAKFSGMGTRAVNFVMPEQDRVKTCVRSAAIAEDINESRERIKAAFTQFFAEHIPLVKDMKLEVPADVSSRIIKASNFSSLARSPVERDMQGRMCLVLSPEMPMRMSNILHNVCKPLMALEGGVLNKSYEAILYKIAMDSIPKGRRIVLKKLAQYATVYTKQLAIDLKYETQPIRKWLEELNVLGICDREKGGGSKGDKWVLKQEFRDLMAEFDAVKYEGGDLVSEDTEEDMMNDYMKGEANSF